MASIILPLALGGSRKADGTVNAGGLVFLSLSGSPNSSVTGYLDRDKNAAATLDGGGYRLDQAGKIALFVDTTCKVIVQDTNGVNVDSFVYEVATNAGLVEILNPGFTGVSPTSGALVAGGRSTLDTALSSLYSSLGGLDGKYRGVYGTADTNVKAEIEQIGLTPQRFGAKGDGVTDDTAAFLSLAAAQSASGLAVFLPKGTYKISSAITFGAAVTITGVSSAGSIITQSNAISGGIVIGNSSVLRNLSVRSSVASSGVGISCGFLCGFFGVNVDTTTGTFVTGVSCTAGQLLAYDCILQGLTNGTLGVVTSDLPSSISPVTALTTYFFVKTTDTNLALFSYQTQDLANGGTAAIGSSITDWTGRPILHQRIRGTSAGAGTVNAGGTINTVAVQFIVLECFNNSGGAFTFTLSAVFKGSGNPAPGNGLRILVLYAYNSTEGFYMEVARSAAY